jgi:type IV pilus assembly protein PilA
MQIDTIKFVSQSSIETIVSVSLASNPGSEHGHRHKIPQGREKSPNLVFNTAGTKAADWPLFSLSHFQFLKELTMKRSIQKGFTLIELMIVVAIIGILAAVALPAYQDYMVRAKASELILALDAPKTSIAEFYAQNTRMPPNATSAGFDTSGSKYVASVALVGAVDTATLTATAQALGPSDATGVIVMIGTGTPATGKVLWECGKTAASTLPGKYRPASCK